jgi:fatty-acyl-CoA synthase
MYDLDLTTSHAQPQSDIETRDITIGALLREVAAARPEAEALVEVKQNGTRGRRWTYAELMQNAERLAMALSTTVCAWRKGSRLVAQQPRMGPIGICQCPIRSSTGDC